MTPTTDSVGRAAHRLMQAERTGDVDAIRKAKNYLSFYKQQAAGEGARAWFTALANDPCAEAERQHNEIGNAHYATY